MDYRTHSSDRRDSSPGPRSIHIEDGAASQNHRTGLRPDLKERHVNMMAFSAALGVGLFLQGGKVIFLAGPGLTVIAYLLMGTVMWSTMASIGEMTAVFPVKGPLFEFPRRFLDESIGFATAWLCWFAWVVVIAAELLAITQIMKFEFPEAYLKEQQYPSETLGWKFGQNTNPGVWVGIFLITIGTINLLPVKWYGKTEYWFGCLKIIFITGLIMFNVVLNARKRFHSSRFWTYEEPYSFATHNMTARQNPGQPPVVYTGSLGTFSAMWTAMTTIIFSMIGFEVVAVTAAENKDLGKDETIKLASRKISLRVIILYTLAAFTVGLNVPFNDPQLQQLAINSVKGGQTSVFILAAVREHVQFWPGFFNGFFVFSATTAGLNALYSASRSLHALASAHDAWPQWGPVESLRTRLERTWHGVPYNAVFASWVFGFLGFLSTSKTPTQALGRIVTNSVVSMLIVYAMNNAAYLQYYRSLKRAHLREDGEIGDDIEITKNYDRKGPQWAYKSHGQWLRATYGLITTLLLALFNGWRVFIPPFSSQDFVASYISIFIFIIITLLYFFKLNGFNPRNWRRNASKMRGLVPTTVLYGNSLPHCDTCGGKHRRGKLRLPDKDRLTIGNGKAVAEWVWTWVK